LIYIQRIVVEHKVQTMISRIKWQLANPGSAT